MCVWHTLIKGDLLYLFTYFTVTYCHTQYSPKWLFWPNIGNHLILLHGLCVYELRRMTLFEFSPTSSLLTDSWWSLSKSPISMLLQTVRHILECSRQVNYCVQTSLEILEVCNKSQNSLYHCWLCFVDCCHHVDIVYVYMHILYGFICWFVFGIFFLLLLSAATLYVWIKII